MTTQQPIWKELHKSDYSAVYVDTTGVYPPEMEVASGDYASDDDGTVVQVHRFPCEQLVQRDVDGVMILVDQRIHELDRTRMLPHPLKSYDEWFTEDLGKVADFIGQAVGDLTDALCGDDVAERAMAYEAIGAYHGMDNLDEYPHEMTVAEWTKR